MNKTSRVVFLSKLVGVLIVSFAFTSVRAQTNETSVVTNLPPAPRRPNILLILADNIGYGDLGSYGQTKIKTPHLDQLAAEGIRFTSFYAGSPNDEPSRASLFTGLEPRHIAGGFGQPLPVDALTVAELLKETGYSTGLVGEWNLGDTPSVQPMAKGFDQFAGFLSQAHARDYFTETIYRQNVVNGTNMVAPIPANWKGAHGKFTTDLIGEAAGNIMKMSFPDKRTHYRGHFFLCVAYPIPHNGTPPVDGTYASEPWPQAAKDRATLITRMDASIGKLLDQLDKSPLVTNTVVIFTSVGGPQQEGAMDPKFFNSAGPLRGHAGTVYEGGIRVPMIIRWPAKIKPGQVSDFTWASWDFLPTAAEIASIKPPRQTDGISILPVLAGKGKKNVHENFYWESRDDSVQQAARMGDWKIVRFGTNTPELYNLKKDIGETNDVSGKNSDVVKKMVPLLSGAPK